MVGLAFMPRSAEEMVEVRANRGPFSDPRDGRLLRQIRFAFWSFEGVGSWRPKGTPDEVTTAYLMSYCYPVEHYDGRLKSWHRTNTIKAARQVAIPVRRRIGKGAGSGRPFVWEPIPGALELRAKHGRWVRRQQRKGLSIDE
jgi:hypothetical protein